MPEKEDDPRQVLAILNSLGFVGITAEQLKAFMKDLKLLRKIKERQRQQWREEMKRKIFFKQQKALAEILNDSSKTGSNSNSDSNSASKVCRSASDVPDDVIKIKIRCISESDGDNDDEENQDPQKVAQRHQSPNPHRVSIKKEIKIDPTARSQQVKPHETQKYYKEIDNRRSKKSESEIINSLSDQAGAMDLSEKVTRRSRSKSIASESSSSRISRGNLSRSTSRSRPKSFIRPWKLNPEVQRFPQQKLKSTKSDPVMLYQKYQKEWKKNPLPGENLHTRVRWAVRQKMLGTDPMPRPILKKSASTMSVRKR